VLLVDTIKLYPDRSLAPQKPSENINRILLKLNGNHAVRVRFNTEFNALSGPETIYINPFTKQVIGMDIRD